MPTFRAADVKGLTPAVDPTRSDELFVLRGKNYVFDAIGPKSAFGNRFRMTTQFDLGQANQYQATRVKVGDGRRVFDFVNPAIQEWNDTTQSWETIYTHGDLSNYSHKWTQGYLNGYQFFCHPGVGIVKYDVLLGTAELLNTPGVPEDPIAIVVSNGRLCIMSRKFFYYSAPSDGTNFNPDVGGAGFFLINDRVAGDAIMLNDFGAGVLIWTTGGVMRAEFTGDKLVWRFRGINTEYQPVNSFCTFQMDDNTVVILDERGLFQSKGEAPTPMTPLFNEFLLGYIRKNRLTLGDNVRLVWDDKQRFLYLSVSTSYANPIYERAFVLYPPMDKWGEFSEPHYGIFPIRFANTLREGDYFGFMGTDRRVRYWTDVGSTEIYDAGEILKQPLNAYVWIGWFRLVDNVAFDELAEIQSLVVRSNQSGPPDEISEDFATVAEGFDPFDATTETAGFEPFNYVNHKLRIVGTIDATTAFATVEPALIKQSQGARYYSCTVTGLWHFIELKADEVGEAFYLRTLEINAVSAGRLI